MPTKFVPGPDSDPSVDSSFQISQPHQDESTFLDSDSEDDKNSEYERQVQVTSFTMEILSAKRTIDKTPETHEDLHKHLNNLGNLYRSRFKLTRKLADISEALSLGLKAVSLTPEQHVSLPMYLNDLATGYESRFRHTNEIVDLSESISYRQKAIHLTPEGHPTLPTELTALGDSYFQRFEWTGKSVDVFEAILCQKKAVHLTSEGDLNMPARLHSLGTFYTTYFECTGDVIDVSKAIISIQKSIQLTSEGDPKLIKRLDNLASLYQSRFQKTGNLADLSRAISSREEALNLTPDGHADIPVLLYNLGYSYEALYRHTKDQTVLDKAASSYSNAVSSSTGIPSFKLLASKRLAKISEELYPIKSINAYTNAIQFVTQLASLHSTIDMRHNNLRHISDTSTLAAASAFKLGRSDLALEWLEQGRGLVWGQLNNLRTPMDDLQAKHPDLADEIVRVASTLELSAYRPVSDDSSKEDSSEDRMRRQQEYDTHMRLAQEWDGLLAKVQTLPDFENFLQPLSCSTIIEHIPKSGLIILVNVHQDRCDALALVPGTNQPVHIPLPEFSHAKAVSLRNHLQANLRAAGIRMRDGEPLTRGMLIGRIVSLEDILSQLWLRVVKPILEALGYSEPPVERKRIWWCTTGPLSFLPIHAAGIYGEPTSGAGTTILDFAISSYSPTVRAILDRLKMDKIIEHKKSGLLIISQPNTPGLSPIPKTTEEVQIIEKLAKDHVHVSRVCHLEGAAATVDQTALEMETYSSVHFACHASQNTKQPLRSAFALHDGRLELSSIIQKRLEGVDLAFLSACQTSTGDETLSEEAVHLAAGMLAAGYRSVVATMWSIRDSYAPELAKDFYSYLLERSVTGTFTKDNTARALHHAIQNQRKKLTDDNMDLESSLLVWVPYVHFGF